MVRNTRDQTSELGSMASPDEVLKVFNDLHCNLHKTPDTNQWIGDCPICGKDEHFYLNPTTTKWDCKVCGAYGNQITFFAQVMKAWNKATTKAEWKKLSDHRGIPIQTLKWFNLACYNNKWYIPIYSEKGTVRDVRVYNFKKVMATTGAKLQLGGMYDLITGDKNAPIWICEGEWDAFALRWLLDSNDRDNDIIVWVPGASVFKSDWVNWFSGRHVVCCYDADDAGERGALKAYKLLSRNTKSLKFIQWPGEKDRGYDVRDFVREGMANDGATATLEALQSLLERKPKNLQATGPETGAAPEGVDLTSDLPEPIPCSFQEVIDAFSKHILVNADTTFALKVMFAVVLSNSVGGDPLWIYIVGPPGSGKTLMLSSFSEAKQCLFRSTLTAHSLVSGWKGEGANDPSLIPKLKGMTFVLKDFTEILTMPSMVQDEIFSTLRGAYDGSVQRPFGNGITREYHDCYFSILSGVTNAIHGHRTASLGERFLKFQLKNQKQNVVDDIISAGILNVGREKAIDRELKIATRNFLANEFVFEPLPKISDSFAVRLTALVQLIALLRAQVERDMRTQDITYRPAPEMGTRLAKQLVKLGMMLALIDGKTEIDDDVYTIMERVAFDTAYGFHLDIIDLMMRQGGKATRLEVSKLAKIPISSLMRKFDDLSILGIIKLTEEKRPTKVVGGKPAVIYSVSKKIAHLWEKSQGKVLCQIVKKKKLTLRKTP